MSQALDVVPFRIPMTIPFRGLDVREGLLVRGPEGWGELSPFPDHPPYIVRRWLAATREASFYGWPPPVREEVEVNATVPAVPADVAHEIAARSGCRTVKVKVAAGDDEARVAAVRDALGPGGRVRVDANAAWDLDEAQRKIKILSRYDLEYVEQPVADLEDMAELRRRVDVRLAVDESIRTAEDPFQVNAIEAADLVVLKVHPLGGVRTCLELADRCGLPVVVSSALETSVGLAAGLALAAALTELPHACGLGTHEMLAGDVVADPLKPSAGRLSVRRPAVDRDLLADHRPDPAEHGSQLERLLQLTEGWSE